MSREQLLQRISLPISAGGLGMRPVHLVRHAAYFASLLQMLPDFLRLYPELQTESSSSEAAQPGSRLTELYAELELCRTELLTLGAGNRRIRRQAQQLQLTLEQCIRGEAGPRPTTAAAPALAAASTAAAPQSRLPAAAPLSAADPAQDSSPLPALHKSIDDTWQAASQCARADRAYAIRAGRQAAAAPDSRHRAHAV